MVFIGVIMNSNEKKHLELFGFVEVNNEDGMINGQGASAGCSGNRSDCCTRVCSKDEAFVGNNEDWEEFLSVEGGAVQY